MSEVWKKTNVRTKKKAELCEECKFRNKCTVLCPEAQVYAKQDEIKLKEKRIGSPEYGKRWPKMFQNLSKREKGIVTLLALGVNKKEILQRVEITEINFRKIVSRIRLKRQNLSQI